MKTLLIFCISLLSITSLYSQKSPSAADTSKVFAVVQQKPQFPGDIYKWLRDNVRYPEDARKDTIHGTVYMQFVIEKDGSISNVGVLRGIQGGSSLDNEAVRVVSVMPKWTPGMQDGNPVRVQYYLPIRFMLNGDNPSNQKGNSQVTIDTGKVFTFVQQKPQFPGDIYKFISDNVVYPEDARKNNIQGTVYVQFIVERSGAVSSVKVSRGIQGGRSLENEAVRVISSMPNWTPGTQNGHTVRVSYMLPIHFALRDNASNPNKN